MYNKEEKEATVITVTSKKNSKDRRNTMENKKKNFKLIKFKKDVQGITLIALVVTIIVLLILAGIALNLTIGQNGIFSRAQTAANTWRNAETNEQLAMGELEDWMDEYIPKPPEPISETESFVGYYADTNGDKQADGIIFVDLADTEHSSGSWNDDTGYYEYTPVTEELKQYTICNESYTGFEDKWTRPVLTAIEGTSGADRFYVMALEDFKREEDEEFDYCWYDDASGKLTDYIEYTENDFSDGRKNTIDMIREWNLGENGKYEAAQNQGMYPDLWGVIQTAVEKIENPTWFVSSKSEWAAFGDFACTKLGVSAGNYQDYGLSDLYWTSSQSTTIGAYVAFFNDGDNGHMDYYGVDYYVSVRLATIF